MIQEYWQQNPLEDREFKFAYICSLLSNPEFIRKQWYFVTKIVLTYCEKKNALVIEKNFWNSRLKLEFAKILRSLEQFIQMVKGQNNFL